MTLPITGEGYISIQHESTHTDVNVVVTHDITYLLYKT